MIDQISPRDDDTEGDLVAIAADEFLEQARLGANPDPEQFVARYPSVADVLREVLPALRSMQASDPGGEMTGSHPARYQPDVKGSLGDFQIIREIGRGGMGVVYEAQQITLDRRVALKTLPFASAIDPVRLNRFKNEAQAAAQLHHPNIVPVYAVGSDRGVWYYAMQIVDGRSLAEVLASIHDGDNPDAVSHILPQADRTVADGVEIKQDSMDAVTATRSTESPANVKTLAESGSYLRVVVELCIQAARALEHAHGMDIVHRDIKPGNLMLDGTGRLWVTDFGLARVRNGASVTATGDVVGTLAYMSPEQASGNKAVVDHRSDIYSLGATLYELLTLHPPFEEEHRAALLKRITSEEPAPLRKLNPQVPVDLETIVLKCLSLDPGARYQTATALEGDLTNFLADRPIAARRPGVLERFSKWARRHRALVATASIAILLLTVGLAVSTGLIASEQARTAKLLKDVSARERALRVAVLAKDAQREKAQQNLRRAAENLRRAEENFRQSRDVLDFFMTKISDDVPQTAQQETIRRSLLEKSLAYYQSFIEQANEDSALRDQLARSHRRVATILYEIGTTEHAQQALELALQVQEQLAREHPFDRNLQRGLRTMYAQLRAYSDNELVKLVREESVREDLGMFQDQVCRSELILRDYYRFSSALDLRNPTSVRQHIRGRTEIAIEQIREMLTPEQFGRLEQIKLQVRGTTVWFERGVIQRLGLTLPQRDTIREIVGDAETEARNAFAIREWGRAREIRRESQQAIEAVLDSDQKARWHRMKGRRFDQRLWVPPPNLGRPRLFPGI